MRKSRGVREVATKLVCEDELHDKTIGDWWDRYANHQAITINDFYGWIKYDELLKISDRYPYKVAVKGSFSNFLAEWIFITSNILPEDWYRFHGYNWLALKTRIGILRDSRPNPYLLNHTDTLNIQIRLTK